MFTVTEQWLKENYGSADASQEQQAVDWLKRYGQQVPTNLLHEWAKWKHVCEYQVNVLDIVPKTLDMIGKTYQSELRAHRYINMMRVPLSASYEDALYKVKPTTILELGVGGDSAISTSIFLAYLENIEGGHLKSIDINPLGKTWDRYCKYIDTGLWEFEQLPAEDVLNFLVCMKQRFDMIFIDTSHSYSPTLREMQLASKITNHMLMDDATFEGNVGDDIAGGVKLAIERWCKYNPDWKRTNYWNDCTVLLSREV